MRISKNINSVLVTILAFLLAFKLTLLTSKAFQPIEIGEFQINSKYSQICEINNQEIDLLINQRKDFSFKNITQIINSKPYVCNEYWGKNIMRGFYVHHYQSIFKDLDPKNGFLKNLSKGLNHQYGLISIIFPWIISLSKIRINIQVYSLFAFLTGILLNFLVAYFAKTKQILSSQEFSVITILITFTVFITDVNQFLLSPGFSPIRVLPINIFSLVLIALARNKIKINFSIISILILNFLLLSPQFEILIFLGVIFSYFLSLIFEKQESMPNKELFKKQLLNYQKLLLIIFSSILIKILLLWIIGDANLLLYSSTGETSLHKKSLLIFFMIYSGLWIINGINSMSTSENFNDIENKLNLSSPLMIYPSLLFSYSAKFWGSPNHFFLYLLSVVMPMGILVYNIINVRQSNHYRISRSKYFQEQFYKITNFLFFKLTLIRSNYKSNKSIDIFSRLFFVLITYLLLFIGAIHLVLIGTKIYSSEIVQFNKAKQYLGLDNQQIKSRFCQTEEIEINSFLINSCSAFNTNLNSQKILLSKSLKFSNSSIYLSDNDSLIQRKNREKLMLGGSFTPLSGKLEIITNPLIRNAFDKSFNKFSSIKYLNSEIYSQENFENLFDSLLDSLIDDLFIYDDFEKRYKSQNLVIDKDLMFRAKQLYIYSFALWSDPNFSIHNAQFQEVTSKLYKYLWRIQLIQKRTKEGLTLIDNIKIDDILKR